MRMRMIVTIVTRQDFVLHEVPTHRDTQYGKVQQ